MPLFLLPLILSVANVVLSSAVVGLAVLAETGDWGAAGTAFAGSLVNHIRQRPTVVIRAKEGKLMKSFMLVCCAMLLTSCAGLKEAIGLYQNRIESIIAVEVAGVYTVQVMKDGKVLVSETWECTQAEGKLTGCHKREPVAITPP